jgi:hypothetical protein
VLSIDTGGPTNPQSTVQVGTKSTTTLAADGSFTLNVSTGATALLVDTHSAFGVFNFQIPAASGTDDVGDLWVGPEKIALQGRVLNSTNSQPAPGLTVSFAGRTGTTDANGNFALADVAYSSATQTAFWGIDGIVTGTGFFLQQFSAFPQVASAGVVNVGDILVTPSSDVNPPPAPFNIQGRVLPPGEAVGTIVTLKQGGTPVRVFNVGSSDGSYFFWVTPGSYTVEFHNNTLNAPTQNVTVPASNSLVTVPDVTLQ